MMRQYAAESPIEALKLTDNHDQAHIEQIFISLIMGRGIVLIDEEMRGMIVGMISPNFWCPKIKEIKELAWWVDPAHRDKMIGGRLLLAFEKEARELIAQGRAQLFSMSLLKQSPQINLESRGFHEVEKTFVRG